MRELPWHSRPTGRRSRPQHQVARDARTRGSWAVSCSYELVLPEPLSERVIGDIAQDELAAVAAFVAERTAPTASTNATQAASALTRGGRFGRATRRRSSR